MKKISKYAFVYQEALEIFNTIGFQPAKITNILAAKYPDQLNPSNYKNPTSSSFHKQCTRWCEKWRDEQLAAIPADLLPGAEPENAGAIEHDFKADIGKWDYKGDQVIKTLDQALAVCEVNLEIWECVRHKFNSWPTTYTTMEHGQRVAKQKMNYQCTLFFEKRKTKAPTKEELGQQFAKDMETMFNRIKKPAMPQKAFAIGAKELLAYEPDVFDAHLGKLAWQPETNNNYDLKIAVKRFNATHDYFIQKVNGMPIEKVVLIVGHDYFHIDNIYNQTTVGTPQDVDGRWQKQWEVGCDLIINTILKYAAMANVDVIAVPGNHDQERIYYLGYWLNRYFEKNPRVNVDWQPRVRKYWKFGKTGIMHTHGKWGKPKDYPVTMLTETAKMKGWQNVTYRECHHGHWHFTSGKEQLVRYSEDRGVITRCMRSISGTDAWHYMSQYIGSIKGGEAFLLSNRGALLDQYYSPS